MGRKPVLTDEEQRLRQATREAHEAAQELRAAIKEARSLEPLVVAHFEEVHRREIEQLSNYFTEESNRHAAALNADVERAREMINEQIMSGKAVFDRHTSTVTISWGPGAFDDSAPLPYPHVAQKEDTL
jgi:hypothetical protein